jgi:hypothetical protein
VAIERGTASRFPGGIGKTAAAEGEIADQVAMQVAKLLVTADLRGAEPRYRLLETADPRAT